MKHDGAFRRSLLLNLAIGLLALGPSLAADDWPQWLGPHRDGVWRETGILDRFPAEGLKARWRTPLGSGYSGPAVARGRVYVMDRSIGSNGASTPAGGIPGRERVLCLNEPDGRILWTHDYEAAYTLSYPAGPRTTPTVDGDRVYTLGAEGHLACLEAGTGRPLWSHELTTDYAARTPTWGFAGHPLVDGRKLICLVGGEGSVAVAFDKENGRELWRALSAREPGYAPPVIYEFGGRRELILWHPEAVNALDPETGQVLWSHRVEARTGLSIATPRQDGDRLFVTSFYNGALMLRIGTGEPTVLWQSLKVSEKDTDGLHSIIPTPVIEAGYLYGVCSYGQLRCLKADTGERIWETFAATTGKSERWGNAFLVKQANRFFLFNELGHLIIARLTPEKYDELSRAPLLDPTNTDAGRPVVWSHPAFANRCVYARNDREIVCVSLAAPPR
jgi:outer membrane protein assembly factor BamB